MTGQCLITPLKKDSQTDLVRHYAEILKFANAPDSPELPVIE